MADRGWVDCFGVVASNKKPILIFTIVCALAAGVGYFVMPKTYESGLTMDVGIFSVVSKRTGGSEEISTEPIEPVQVVRDSITSKPFMAELISRLKIDTTPDKLKKKIKATINEDLRDGSGSTNRQIILSTKGSSPEQAEKLAASVADIVIEKHRKLYEQAMENRYAYEETLKQQIVSLDKEYEELQKMMNSGLGRGKDNAVSLVLLQANLYDKERHISELKRELSQAQLLDKTNLKSANTRVTVPPYLPTSPTMSWWMYMAIGVIIGFLMSGGYYIVKESLKAGGPGE
jgi:capsular polysaccharide biosynthesis protein